jgi:phage gp36-like protein
MSYNDIASFRLSAFPSGSYALNSDAEVQAQLDAAASEIDSALLPQHKLPLQIKPPAILEAERVIAAWRLQLFNGARPTSVDERLQSRYFEVVGDPNVPGSGMLYKIAVGKMIFAKETDATPAREGQPIIVAGSDRNSGTPWGVR